VLGWVVALTAHEFLATMGINGSKIKTKKPRDTTPTRRPTVGSKPEINADKVYKLVMLGDGGVGKTGTYRLNVQRGGNNTSISLTSRHFVASPLINAVYDLQPNHNYSMSKIPYATVSVSLLHILF
jgi:hypothetical protein